MTTQRRGDEFGLVSDPHSGFRIELAKASDGEAKLLHIGLQVGDVDSAFERMTEAGMTTIHAPHVRERANIRTACLKHESGLEAQISQPDSR